MTDTIHLALPFIEAAQAQKHVTHNEALQALDALAQLSVIARDVNTPPAAPAEGARYIVGASPTGAFAGHAKAVASWLDGVWRFFPPRPGWLAYVEADGASKLYDGAQWRDAASFNNIPLLGVGTTADAANPLAAKLNSTLFTAKSVAEGGTGDLRFNLNKSAAGNLASQLYQDNFSGRAETGLLGDDHFRVKVSADGATWRQSLDIDPATGAVAFPSGQGDGALAGFRNRLRNAGFTINQRGVAGTVTLAAGAYGHDGAKAGAAGATYTFAASGVETMLTITAGSLILPIENALIEGGTYTFSQAGSAQARVWQGTGAAGTGSYAGAPVTVTGLAGNTQTNVEFSTGTILRPQFEPGAAATTFERRPPTIESFLCQRYFVQYVWTAAATFQWNVYYAGGSFVGYYIYLPVPMRASPTCGLIGAWSSFNVTSFGFVPVTSSVVEFFLQATATGIAGIGNPANGGFFASAEI